MAHCEGTLLVHLDGTPAACTEELMGRCCPGPTAWHGGGTAQCRAMLGPGGCETCEMESWTDDQWRHAAHVARLARRPRHCRVHEVPGRRPGLRPVVHPRPFEVIDFCLVGGEKR